MAGGSKRASIGSYKTSSTGDRQNVGWTSNITEGSDWISCTPSGNGGDNDIYQVDVIINDSFDIRQGTIVFTQDESGYKESIFITQEYVQPHIKLLYVGQLYNTQLSGTIYIMCNNTSKGIYNYLITMGVSPGDLESIIYAQDFLGYGDTITIDSMYFAVDHGNNYPLEYNTSSVTPTPDSYIEVGY